MEEEDEEQFAAPVVQAYVPPPAATPTPELKNQDRFEVFFNDGAKDDMAQQRLIYLIQVKTLFSKCLPKMPRKYIVRLVLDRNHRCLVLIRGESVIAGICFRPFVNQGFAEVVFVAVDTAHQVTGIGTRMMSTLKEHVKRELPGIDFFLTYPQ